MYYFQITTDRFATYGAMAGVGVFKLFRRGLIPGLITGFTLGTIWATFPLRDLYFKIKTD